MISGSTLGPTTSQPWAFDQESNSILCSWSLNQSRSDQFTHNIVPVITLNIPVIHVASEVCITSSKGPVLSSPSACIEPSGIMKAAQREQVSQFDLQLISLCSTAKVWFLHLLSYCIVTTGSQRQQQYPVLFWRSLGALLTNNSQGIFHALHSDFRFINHFF